MGEGDAQWRDVERRELTRTNLRIHFMHHHMQDIIVNLEEGNLTHPLFPSRDMFVTWVTMNKRHPTIALCT